MIKENIFMAMVNLTKMILASRDALISYLDA